jgi:hypothetical protein
LRLACLNGVKNLVKEVIFPAYGDWKIEAYAWCKELARRLNATFKVLQSGDTGQYSDEFAHKILRGDGYYFGHYNFAPIKTHLSVHQDQLPAEFLNSLKDTSGLAVLVLDSKAKFQEESFSLSHHIVLSIPNPIEIKSKEVEFVSILRQISILNLPFDFVDADKQSWISKLMQNLRTFL